MERTMEVGQTLSTYNNNTLHIRIAQIPEKLMREVADEFFLALRSLPENIRDYIRMHIRIFPVYGILDGKCTCGKAECSSIGKHPIINDWPTLATRNPLTLYKWMQTYPNCNWGAAVGNGVIVIDIDADKDGFDSIQRLQADHGTLPDTPTVLTGGGGQHLYYRIPTDSQINNGVNVLGYSGIDIRSDRGYVVTDGSQHKSGNMYQWEIASHPTDVAIAELPEAYIQLFQVADKPRNNPVQGGGGKPWTDVPADQLDKIKDVCARMAYYATPEGAREVSYMDWVATATWFHALSDSAGEQIFHDISALDINRYKNKDTANKWNDTVGMHPIKCRTQQQDHPLEACRNCPFFDQNENPALILRRQLGGGKPWGAPLAQRHNQDRLDSMVAQGEVATTAQWIDGTVVPDAGTDDGYLDSLSISEPAKPVLELAVDNSAVIKSSYESVGKIAEEIKAGADIFACRDNALPYLKQLYKLSPNHYDGALKILVKSDKSKVLDARMLKKNVQDEIAKEPKAEEPTGRKPKTIGQKWPDAPSHYHDISLPFGYSYLPNGIKERAMSDDEADKPITSQPTAVVGWRKDVGTGEITAIIATRTPDSGWVEIAVPPSVFGDPRQTSKLSDQGLSIVGMSSGIAKYLSASYDMTRVVSNVSPLLSVSHCGWVGEDFIAGHRNGGNIQYVPLGGAEKNFTTWPPEWDIDAWIRTARDVFTLFSQIGDHNKMAMIAGWLMASVIAPQLRTVTGNTFPLMHYWGTPGSGKTTIGELCLRLTRGTTVMHSAKGTKFPKIANMASTNALPIAFDEYKLSEMTIDETNFFHQTLKKAYNMEVEERGTQSQRINVYHLRAPIIVIGESKFKTEALIERSLIVGFSKSQISTDHKDALAEMWKLEIDGFGQGLIRMIMDYPVWPGLASTACEEYKRALKVIRDYDMPERQRKTLAVVMAGWDCWHSISTMTGADLNYPTVDEFVRAFNDFSQLGGQKMSYVDKIMEATAAMLGNQRYDLEWERTPTSLGPELRIAKAKWHKALYQYYRDAGRAGELQDDGTTEAELRDHMARKGSYVVGVGKPLSINKVKQRCIVIDLGALEKATGIDPETFNPRGADDPNDI